MLPRSALLTVAIWAVFAAAIRVSIVPPESCGDTSVNAIRLAADEARDWIIRNQGPDGRYTYLYFSDGRAAGAEYNEIRHAGVTMALYQKASHDQDAIALAAADAGLAWMEANLIRAEDWQAFAPNGGDASLGATALMTASVAERRLATGDESYDPLLRDLGRFLLRMQREDGNFAVRWLVAARMPDPEGSSRYYPGESLFALTLLHQAFPDEGWDAAAKKAVRYLVDERDEAEGLTFRPLPDQWLSYGLGEMASWGLDERDAEHVRRLAGRFGLLVRTEAQREGSWYGSLVRGRDVRAAGVGTWVEGLAGLWRAAATDDRLANLEAPIRERLTCSAGILAARQVSAEEAAGYSQPGLAQGAWFRGGETRMDDQQHALSGLLYTLDAIEGRSQRAPSKTLEPTTP